MKKAIAVLGVALVLAATAGCIVAAPGYEQGGGYGGPGSPGGPGGPPPGRPIQPPGPPGVIVIP